MNTLIPFAQQMLAKNGEFYPFGASMGKEGELTHVGASTGSEHPASQELIKLLIAGFQRDAAEGNLRAAGICIDVRIVLPGAIEKSDAICVQLEHVNGEAIEIYVPYRKGWLGKIKYGELFASKGKSAFFA
ncbi:MAG: hypothetical protein H7144_00760 [Burkholderiales bacterium]|nr:hypothetical protein [Phycisphaerae bacterium]